jgi:hypothetical protein
MRNDENLERKKRPGREDKRNNKIIMRRREKKMLNNCELRSCLKIWQK